MVNGNNSPVSNAVLSYSLIVVGEYEKMVAELENDNKPVMQGGRGSQQIFNTDRQSFKHAMIIMSFVGMWLHAVLRLKMLSMNMSDKRYQRQKGSPYEQRLMIVGCYDELILEKVSSYRMARNRLLLETDYFRKEDILFVELEAKKAYELMVELTNIFKQLERR